MPSRHAGIVAIWLLVVLALGAGCHSTLLPGERYYLDSPGIGVAYLPRSRAQVHQAALAALRQDLGFTIVSEEPIEARTDTDRSVRIELFPAAGGDTKMQIEMAPDTPEMVIRQIMSKIEARLQ